MLQLTLQLTSIHPPSHSYPPSSSCCFVHWSIFVVKSSYMEPLSSDYILFDESTIKQYVWPVGMFICKLVHECSIFKAVFWKSDCQITVSCLDNCVQCLAKSAKLNWKLGEEKRVTSAFYITPKSSAILLLHPCLIPLFSLSPPFIRVKSLICIPW